MQKTTDRRITHGDIIAAAAKPGVLGSGVHAIPRILATLYKPGVSAREVSGVVAQEPGMTASVLRVANSPLYGQSRTVSTVDHAVLLLGLDAVRGIAAAACMRDAIMRSAPESPVDSEALLRHSIATAVAASALARIARPALATEAFVAGLLHDLGVALLARLDPEAMRTVVDALRADASCDAAALEEEHVGVGHARCAALVFEAWRLPAALVAGAAHHDDPASAPQAERAMASLVCLGNQLAIAGDASFASEHAAPATRSAAAAALLGITDDDLAAVAAALPAQVAAWRSAFK
jgi:HD-like signal output (HDOD) protein